MKPAITIVSFIILQASAAFAIPRSPLTLSAVANQGKTNQLQVREPLPSNPKLDENAAAAAAAQRRAEINNMLARLRGYLENSQDQLRESEEEIPHLNREYQQLLEVGDPERIALSRQNLEQTEEAVADLRKSIEITEGRIAQLEAELA